MQPRIFMRQRLLYVGRAVVVLLQALAAGASFATSPADCLDPAPDIVRTEATALCPTGSAADRVLMRELEAANPQGSALSGLTIDYPAAGSIFPPDMAAPTILWHDASLQADRWWVQLDFGPNGSPPLSVLVDGGAPPEGRIDPRCLGPTNEPYEPDPYQASAHAWQPTPGLWTYIRERSSSTTATLSIVGFRQAEARPLSRGSVRFSTSTDPVGAPIFYRDVPLMPSMTKDGTIKPLDQSAHSLIAWRLRDVSRRHSTVLLEAMPTCANCHSFSAGGETLGMDLDGPEGDKGAYVIADIAPSTVIRDAQVMTWNDLPDRPADRYTLGFMSSMSPDGRHVVTTVDEAIYVKNFTDYRFIQVFFPTRGALAYYSRETREIRRLPGADDPEYVHCNPVWTPDGKFIYFARAEARDPYPAGRPRAAYAGDPLETQIQYDLYRIPFNAGRGGTAVPVAGASHNGMSNSFPKISPDGEWLVFVKARNGLLMRPDSRLWIVPAAGGEAREMQCNLPLMNSWHSFSPNGRWMVFSSKSNTPYTQMFLTHIDDEGNDSPPLLIENSTAANRAVNIPEFVNVAHGQFNEIRVPAVEHYRYFEEGRELARRGDDERAVAALQRALRGGDQRWRVNDWRIHDSLSKVLLRLGRAEEAEYHIRQSLDLNQYNGEMHANLGIVLGGQGAYGEALHHLDLAVLLEPREANNWYNRATLRLQTGELQKAAEDYANALRLAGPDWHLRQDAERALRRINEKTGEQP